MPIFSKTTFCELAKDTGSDRPYVGCLKNGPLFNVSPAASCIWPVNIQTTAYPERATCSSVSRRPWTAFSEINAVGVQVIACVSKGRREGLCSTCFGIAANQQHLSKWLRDAAASATPQLQSEHSQNHYRFVFYQERELQRKAMGDRQRNLVNNPEGISLEYLLGQVAESAGCPRRLRSISRPRKHLHA